ncbi:MAG TPA: hypothetical protein VNN18_00775 [Candidatus Xenobia bacterium]|nr:hypothetical protein [Candidatus Xenobia bacterium]
MKDRAKLAILGALVLVFVAVNFRNFFGGSAPSAPASAAAPATHRAASGARIPDAALSEDLLQPTERAGAGRVVRNIFEYGSRPVSATEAARLKEAEAQEEAPPPPPPPPPPPVRFYGFAESSAAGNRRVFLTDGENVFVARQGDTILRRYRLTRIGNDSIDIEEISGPNRWTLKMEQP